ncbi:MAG: hypothetical protein GY856_19440 [bacterium]|nr:hypothetical protein [bacterium]
MVVPFKRFFDLADVAATSRRLLTPKDDSSVRSPAAEAPPAERLRAADQPSVAAAGLPAFPRPAVRYKIELWDAILEWVRQHLAADGCFALDDRGFLVASSGEMGAVPPEIFLSAFSSTDDTVASYLDEAHSLRGAIFELRQGIRVTLLPVELPEAQVLVGLLGGTAPTGAEAESLRRTIAEELENFETSNG